MRVAHNEMSLRAGLKQARAEAENAFKDSTVYIEKYVEFGRHVEVQILADNHGNAVHLWERDCSMQRRHQKLVEESPSPVLRQEVREKLCEAAVRLVKVSGYTNAGTVEFLVDKKQNFYILEVNARIQVEHPVTESVTGIDLIKEQIRIAAGEPLSFRQKDVPQQGHSIECRINAEDPSRGFAPSAGTITELRLPRWSRRPARYPRLRRLHHPAQLRQHDRQADRPPKNPRRGDRHHEARLGRISRRRHQDHDPPAPADHGQRILSQRRRRHRVCRACDAPEIASVTWATSSPLKQFRAVRRMNAPSSFSLIASSTSQAAVASVQKRQLLPSSPQTRNCVFGRHKVAPQVSNSKPLY